MQIPTVLIITALNQEKIALQMHSAGAMITLGQVESLTEQQLVQAIRNIIVNVQQRRNMVKKAAQMVDGWGVDRVIMHLRGMPFWLRAATNEDRWLLWEWANDPQTREASFSSEIISREEHDRWYSHQLTLSEAIMLIACDKDDQPIGHIRFERADEDLMGVVSINMSPDLRGRGYGTRLIQVATAYAIQQMNWRGIYAYIKTTNQISVRAFEKAGYDFYKNTTVRNIPAVLYRYSHDAR